MKTPPISCLCTLCPGQAEALSDGDIAGTDVFNRAPFVRYVLAGTGLFSYTTSYSVHLPLRYSLHSVGRCWTHWPASPFSATSHGFLPTAPQWLARFCPRRRCGHGSYLPCPSRSLPTPPRRPTRENRAPAHRETFLLGASCPISCRLQESRRAW